MAGEVRAFLAAGMDGFFTDNPDLGAQAADGFESSRPRGRRGDKAAPRGQQVEVQLLALNDFHGNLEPPGAPSAVSRPAAPSTWPPTSAASRRPTATPSSSRPAT